MACCGRRHRSDCRTAYGPLLAGSARRPGLAALCNGLVLLALLPPEAGTADLVWRLAVCGFGFGLFQSPNNKIIMTSAPPERSGGASGMLSTARLTGQSLGAALVAVIFGIAGPRETAVALSVAATLAAVGCCASTLRTRTGS